MRPSSAGGNCFQNGNSSVGGGREVTREVELYNLDAIIAVGYFDRVVEETRRLEGNQEPKTLGPGKGRKKKP